MALNLDTDATFAGRITNADANYIYGSGKNDSTGDTGDGTQFIKKLYDDVLGFQQALLRGSGQVPDTNPDTAIASQYFKGVIEQAMGRASSMQEAGGSAADAYVLEVKTGNQPPAALFVDLTVRSAIAATNTGLTTLTLPGLAAKQVRLEGSVSNLPAGSIDAGEINTFRYDGTYFRLIKRVAIGAFRARLGGAQTIPDNVITKGQFTNEIYDVNGWYDNVTNYRYTPQITGKYTFSAGMTLEAGLYDDYSLTIQKNGSAIAQSKLTNTNSASQFTTVSVEIDMNGTTDYVECFFTQDSIGSKDVLIDNRTFFVGHFTGV